MKTLVIIAVVLVLTAVITRIIAVFAAALSTANTLKKYIPVICGESELKSAEKTDSLTFTHTFRKGKMREDDFIHSINLWLAQRPYIANAKFSCELDVEAGVEINKGVLERVTVNFEIFKGRNENQYGVCKLSDVGLKCRNPLALADIWKENNPDCITVSADEKAYTSLRNTSRAGRINRTDTVVFFKFNREKAAGKTTESKNIRI